MEQISLPVHDDLPRGIPQSQRRHRIIRGALALRNAGVEEDIVAHQFVDAGGDPFHGLIAIHVQAQVVLLQAGDERKHLRAMRQRRLVIVAPGGLDDCL